MKKVVFFLLFFPFGVCAQKLDADAFVEKVLAVMKADFPLQLEYSYKVFDDDNEVVQEDKGVMKLDGNRYVLLMNDMKVWCNGDTQWSYMREIDEIYITSASSDEAQALSPLTVMENYRKGCSKFMELHGDDAVITFASGSGADFETVVFVIDEVSCRLKSMSIVMPEQGRVDVLLDKYQTGCRFADNVYECPVKDFYGVEIVDMR